MSVPWVYSPAGPQGLHPNEVTIAERLKPLGYATLCVGKWHLGDQPEFLPTRQGFDHYFGVPYSNDMQRTATATGERVVPLLRDDKVAELLTDAQQGRRRERRAHSWSLVVRRAWSRPLHLARGARLPPRRHGPARRSRLSARAKRRRVKH